MAKPLKKCAWQSSDRLVVPGWALLPISHGGMRVGSGAPNLMYARALGSRRGISGIFYRKAAFYMLTIISFWVSRKQS